MKYSESQVQAAKETAQLSGYQQDISDANAIAFLDWYFANKVKYQSEVETILAGILQENPVGVKQMEKFWSGLLGDKQ